MLSLRIRIIKLFFVIRLSNLIIISSILGIKSNVLNYEENISIWNEQTKNILTEWMIIGQKGKNKVV